MKMTRWQVTCFILGLIFLGCGVAAESQPRKTDSGTQQEMKQHKMERKHGGMKHKTKSYADVVIQQAQDLGLTDEQLGKIARIRMAERRTRKEIMGKLRKSMKKALKGLQDPVVDDAEIRKAGVAHAADFDALIDAALKSRNDVDAVLTPEQREKLKAMKHSRGDKGQKAQ